MLSNCKRWGSWALAFALLAALLVPSLAFAGESTYTIEGDVVVTLQASQDPTPAPTPTEPTSPTSQTTPTTSTNQTNRTNATNQTNAAKTSSTVSSGTSSASAKTGDAVAWLALGVAAIGVLAAVAARAGRKASDGPAASCGEPAKTPGKGLLAVATACLLAALLSFGQFATHAAYAAEGLAELDGVSCGGTVVVDETGKVISSSFTIENGSISSVSVKGIQAPDELDGFSATVPSESIEAGGEYDGEWASEGVSSDLVQKLKDNDGELTVKMAATVSVTTYTVSFDTSGVDCTIDDQIVQENGKVTAPADSDDYDIDGWYTDKECTKAFDFATPVTSDMTLYAKWTVKGYWLAAASAEDPTANVVKTMSQVDADVAAIMAGDAAVISEYNKYLSDDSVHLYTRWSGSTKDASGDDQTANSYAEFRVIQVGEHDKEGCNITFQTTHLLPDSYVMNSTDTNKGGWGATELRERMQPGGDIYQSFDSDFTDKILTVSKASSEGDSSRTKVYSDNKFWIVCYSELSGVGVADLAEFEGSQYEYWKEQGVSHDKRYFECLALKTRAGNLPADLEMGLHRWWERSPLLNTLWPGCFTEVMIPRGSGAPASGTMASYKLGVSLAFCF